MATSKTIFEEYNIVICLGINKFNFALFCQFNFMAANISIFFFFFEVKGRNFIDDKYIYIYMTCDNPNHYKKQGHQQLVCKPDNYAGTKHKAVASRSWFSFLQFCRKYKQPEPQNFHMTITITQGHLHTRQLCRRKHKAVATHKAEAGSHSSNSAENTNSQSHELPMTITIHSAGASSQSSNLCRKYKYKHKGQ